MIFKKFLPVLSTGIFIIIGTFLPSAKSFEVQAFSSRYKNITINGVDVKGMTYAEAEKAVLKSYEKELKDKSFTVKVGGGEYVFCYPEINYESNLEEVLSVATGEKYGKFDVIKKTVLQGKENFYQGLMANYGIKPKDAEIIFEPFKFNKFAFNEEKEGYYPDIEKLDKEIEQCLCGKKASAKVSFLRKEPSVTTQSLIKLTRKKSGFTTYYFSSSPERKHNIKLAASKINGSIVESGETFSFNAIVGVRNEENGFLPAKIILDGQFATGVGGGVCQVSTTLYNAALVAGLKIIERHPHSLAVSYVEPSFDAMVNSDWSDLKFVNDTNGKIFISALADDEHIKIEMYGLENEFEIERESISKKNEENGKTVIISYGRIKRYKKGKLIDEWTIYKDKYSIKEEEKIQDIQTNIV